MSRLSWYWHRLRAMSPPEMARHARKKFRQLADARRARERDWTAINLECSQAYPKLPKPEEAPEVLRHALRRDVENILAGHWKAFAIHDLKVDDPPNWHCDYLVGKDLATMENAFRLNYRELPGGADIKLIWELSRWHSLVRLAMAAYVLGDVRAGQKCLEWLEDWVQHNPPYRGWNWTSALEVGLRLIQFTWIDGLLSEAAGTEMGGPGTQGAPGSQGVPGPPSPRPSPPGEGEVGEVATPPESIEGKSAFRAGSADLPLPGGEGRGEGDRSSRSPYGKALDRLRRALLPPHAWYGWRHQSFGSSANNHLLGELAGCILATVRWPGLASCGAGLEELQARWEYEVLTQFAEDGGNREQALNYQLFSWELCWLAQTSLESVGRRISPLASQRLNSAWRFFWEVQARRDQWDYGDSDNAFVVPFCGTEQPMAQAWYRWFENPDACPELRFWCGLPSGSFPRLKRANPLHSVERGEWWHYQDSGLAICESGFWWLRWDLSPLGYLATAAHGHLDALHLSAWFKGVALVIDPGTGAYFAEPRLRTWLASRGAHNGPCPTAVDYPRRLGPFLWAEHHAVPEFEMSAKVAVGSLRLPQGVVFRSIRRLQKSDGWEVADQFVPRLKHKAGDFTVLWQFAPGSWVKRISERSFSLHRAQVALRIEVDENWSAVELFEPVAEEGPLPSMSNASGALEGIVSPGFRQVCRAPFLKLTARPGDKPCVFTTAFLASPPA